MPIGIGAASLIAGLANAGVNAANAGISNSEMLSQSQTDSYNTASSYNMAYGNSWTDADTANKIAQNEAEKNRLYQTYMANTAYQRAVADLKAAGLNPVLAAWNGGSPSPAGTLAQTYMNSGSNSYSEGGSSQYGESHESSNSSSSSSSQPAIIKLMKSAANFMSSSADVMSYAKAMAGGYIGK